MKKLVALVLALVMTMALCACGSTAPAAPSDTAAPQTPAAPATNDKPDPETPAEPAAPAWPNSDEITIYAGYAVGSLTDVSIRVVADYITEKTGITVNLVNDDVGGGANLAAKLVKAEPDGNTLMFIGMNCISNYYKGVWSVNPADASLFKLVCGGVMPDPDSGCMILTQADSPFDTWDELAAYAEEHPGEVTVASISGKVMDIKMKALFNGTGVSKNIRWVSTTNADATAALLGDNIDIIMLDEQTALSYLKDGGVKAIINSRFSDDYSQYAEGEDKDMIMAVPTLKDVFGAEGENYMVANRSMFVAPAGTPDEVVAAIREIVDGLLDENEGEWLERKTVAGGTSTFREFDPDATMAEWQRLDPIIKEIVEMG